MIEEERGVFTVASNRKLDSVIRPAQTEIKLWFKEEELVNWTPANAPWLYE
jgi:nucleoside-diphosphate kinase